MLALLSADVQRETSVQMVKSPFSVHWLQCAQGNGTLKDAITVQSWGRADFDAVGMFEEAHYFQQWKMQHIVDKKFLLEIAIFAWFFLLCKEDRQK